MDSPNINPPLNIIMSFTPDVIHMIKGSANLEALKKKAEGVVGIHHYRQGPASDFLKLEHEFAFAEGGVGDSVRLVLEFLDPDSNFEIKLSTNPNLNMPAKADLASRYIETLRRQVTQATAEREEKIPNLRGRATTALRRGYKGTAGDLYMGKRWNVNIENLIKETKAMDSQVALILQRELDILNAGVEEAKLNLRVALSTADAIGGADGKEVLNKYYIAMQEEVTKSFTQRPVWVTYGVGNNFKDWSPVMVFERALEANYNFTGEGVRKLTVIYDGQTISPYLTGLASKPLGLLAMGEIMKGDSDRLFDETSTDSFLEEMIENYPDEKSALTERLGNYLKPSIHKTITDIYRRYLKRGTSFENIIVAFPDLDLLLSNAYDISTGKTTAQAAHATGVNPFWHSWSGPFKRMKKVENTAHHILAWKDLMETFDFKIADFSEAGFQSPVDISPARLEEWSYPEEVPYYMKTRVIKTVLSSNNSGDLITENKLLDPLYRSVDKLINTALETNTGLKFGRYLVTEHDSEMINLWHEAGLVRDPNKPVLIFGDEYFINKYLYGHALSEVSLDAEGEPLPADTGGREGASIFGKTDSTSRNILGTISVFDRIKGINYKYLQKVSKILYPAPWRTPFGATGLTKEEKQDLEADTNISLLALQDLQELNSDKSLNMPVFTLGTQNTNVLGVNFDIQNQYFSLINNFNYQTMTVSQFVHTLLSKGKANACMGLLGAIQKLNLNATPEPPPGFVALIRPWLIRSNPVPKKYAGAGASTWATVFRALGILGTVPAALQVRKARNIIEDTELADLFGGKSDTRRFLEWDWEGMKTKKAAKAMLDKVKVKRTREEAMKAATEDYETAMISFYWKRFKALLEKISKPIKEIGGSAPTETVINHNNMIADAMVRMGFAGSIKTLPMFHLSSRLRVSTRDALLYAVEPKLIGLPDGGEEVALARKWFSGVYTLIGYKHVITGGEANSNFSFYRAPGRALKLSESDKEQLG